MTSRSTEDQAMFRAPTKFCLLGASMLALACNGQILGKTSHGSTGAGKPDPGDPADPGDPGVDPMTGGGGPKDPGMTPVTTPKPGEMPAGDPPSTIGGAQKCAVPGKPGPR